MKSIAVVIALALSAALPLAWSGPSDLFGSPSTGSCRQSPITPTEEMQVVAGIEATKPVHDVLEKVRAALGGQKTLLEVKSLLIEGSRGDASFTYRILLPDRFQWNNNGPTFTIDGPSGYVQRPDASDATKAMSRKNATKTFVTISLTTLIRVPSALKVRATLRKPDKTGSMPVVFTTEGGFAILLEVDSSSFLPKAYSYVDNLTEGDCAEPPIESTASRRVVYDEYRQVAGIRFPTRMTDTITTADGRAIRASLQFTSIRVNEGISQADFEKQGEGTAPRTLTPARHAEAGVGMGRRRREPLSIASMRLRAPR
ncbi:MAG: hypothetical protein NT151_04485 [Acidobacteria bacterium]|nr:hypothetical protein [Acidobacteriota bacterium]